MAEYEPMDVTVLRKGDYIPPDVCEKMLGVKRSERRYSLELCALVARIKSLADEHGNVLSFCSDGDGIRVHTDEEASDYHAKAIDRARAKAARSLRDMVTRVDTSQLTEDQRRAHDRIVSIEALRQQAGKRAVRKLVAREKAATKRLTQDEPAETVIAGA